jgi:hypothetical protein
VGKNHAIVFFKMQIAFFDESLFNYAPSKIKYRKSRLIKNEAWAMCQ